MCILLYIICILFVCYEFVEFIYNFVDLLCVSYVSTIVVFYTRNFFQVQIFSIVVFVSCHLLACRVGLYIRFCVHVHPAM